MAKFGERSGWRLMYFTNINSRLKLIFRAFGAEAKTG